MSWWTDLEQSGEDVKLKHGDVVVAGQVDGGLQGHGLQTQTDRVELMESLAEGSPRHDGPAGVRSGSEHVIIVLLHKVPGRQRNLTCLQRTVSRTPQHRL